jgi:hypothetical protein
MSATTKTRYAIELLCDYPEWWRYNVYIMAVGFDVDGRQSTINNLVDKVADIGSQQRKIPDDYPTPRVIRLDTQECAFVDIYIYIVANSFPATDVIGDWPPFPATMRVSANGMPVEEKNYEINQWGGLTIAAHRVDIFG